jgi:hypothetical protein
MGEYLMLTESLRLVKNGPQKLVHENGTKFIRKKVKKITVPFSNKFLKPANSSD